MASEKVNALIEEIKAMSVLELSELVHEIEDVFGVSAAAAVAAAPAAGAAAAAVEEKTEFDVVTSATRRSTSSRKSAVSPVWAWLRPRRRSRASPPSSRSRSPRMRLRRSSPSWKLPAPPSSSSKLFLPIEHHCRFAHIWQNGSYFLKKLNYFNKTIVYI